MSPKRPLEQMCWSIYFKLHFLATALEFEYVILKNKGRLLIIEILMRMKNFHWLFQICISILSNFKSFEIFNVEICFQLEKLILKIIKFQSGSKISNLLKNHMRPYHRRFKMICWVYFPQHIFNFICTQRRSAFLQTFKLYQHKLYISLNVYKILHIALQTFEIILQSFDFMLKIIVVL